MTWSKIFKLVTKKEWLFVIFLAFVVVFLGNFNLIYGWLTNPAGQVFTGIHFAALNDWFVYYSYLEQVRQGHWLFNDLFTSEPHLSFFNPLWLMVGLFATVFGLSNVLAFNVVKIFLAIIFCLLAYVFLAYIFPLAKTRKLAILLLLFSSGLGFLLISQLIKFTFNFANGHFNWPMDLWVPEFNTFLTLYYSPHFIASLILILLIFLNTVLFIDNKKISYGFWAGMLALILFSFHPFHILTIFSVILIYFIVLMFQAKKILWPLAAYYLILFLVSLPGVLYYLYLLRFDLVMQQKALQNLCFTTPLWLTLFSLCLPLVFAVFGLKVILAKKSVDHQLVFIIIWLATSLVLIYFPVNYQRRMSEGLQFPLVVLATIGILGVYQLIKNQKNQFTSIIFKQRYALAFILFLFLAGSNLFQLAADFYIYSTKTPLAYLDQNLVSAAAWLKNVESDKVIFNSAQNIINIIPAYSGRTVYVGHGVETVNFKSKQDEVDWFFKQNRPSEVEKNFLSQRGINYLFFGPAERRIGTYDPDNKSYLKAVYHNSQVSIYQVLD
jgi:hypothetical protein